MSENKRMEKLLLQDRNKRYLAEREGLMDAVNAVCELYNTNIIKYPDGSAEEHALHELARRFYSIEYNASY